MSPLTRFMTAARGILDEQDRKAARTDRPPFFIRTTWLFAELADLRQPSEADTFKAITVARLSGDVAAIGRLVDQVHANSEALTGVQRHQRQQICGWIKDQIKREPKP